MKKLDVGTVFLYTDGAHGVNLDSVLLAAFAAQKRAGEAADLCCGCGAVALGLLQRGGADRVTGLEINGDAAALFEKAIMENGLSDRLCCITGDVREAGRHLSGPFDLVVSNPPFFEVGAAKHSPDAARAAARGEMSLTLGDVCRAAKTLLKDGGRLALCQRPERLADCMEAMRRHGIEPKRMRLCAYDREKTPWLVLLEGTKGGGKQLDVEPMFYVKDAGQDSEEYKKLFEEVGVCPAQSLS